ncbi:ABC transporter ATP-binding protein [Candidatus Symbiopectobacterium sp. NZEC151]|uniref:ABC transporter ATP-binding protein n=1 Tax=Candidatus Symbiopectobacterium sp. NZEC151 TaxID=2820470 RepID=UPI002227D82B|nr:ABC transporter ATP-binding protein [Candidatus Symbiopectobacterium sp. NZEC151]MCW2474037.1 ABC transporter ATP-binding protein [Candidatus Symbiopectobacterium sp. NZEC151]
MSDVHLSVNQLAKSYPGAPAPAVDDVSLHVPRGEMLALLGPSGCGKTTLLRMIAGLIAPTAGSIQLNGRDISAIPVHQRNMGMVFQAYALFPHLSVAQNIAFGLEMRGIKRAERAKRVQQALALVKLGGLGDRRVSQLSGGQQQRAAIARSLVIEPELLLFDEPLSNLDAKLRDEMRDEIRDLQRRTGITALFVTHDQDEALSMADRIAVMSHGKLEQIGTPDAIFDQPETEFVARFIGNGNFFDATVLQPHRVHIEGLGELHLADALTPGSRVRLLIRPHRLRCVSPGVPSPINTFSGRVTQRVYRGQHHTLSVQVGPHHLLADLPTQTGITSALGDSLMLTVAPADITWVGRHTP